MATKQSRFSPTIPLIAANTRIAQDCAWCHADAEPHSLACPLGERYAQIQKAGGIGFLIHAADDCGALCDQHRPASQRQGAK